MYNAQKVYNASHYSGVRCLYLCPLVVLHTYCTAINLFPVK